MTLQQNDKNYTRLWVHWQTLSHNIVMRTPQHRQRLHPQDIVVINSPFLCTIYIPVLTVFVLDYTIIKNIYSLHLIFYCFFFSLQVLNSLKKLCVLIFWYFSWSYLWHDKNTLNKKEEMYYLQIVTEIFVKHHKFTFKFCYEKKTHSKHTIIKLFTKTHLHRTLQKKIIKYNLIIGKVFEISSFFFWLKMIFTFSMVGVRVRVMVFNATFNNISAISLRSVLLVEETGVPRKKPTYLPQVTSKFYHIML